MTSLDSVLAGGLSIKKAESYYSFLLGTESVVDMMKHIVNRPEISFTTDAFDVSLA